MSSLPTPDSLGGAGCEGVLLHEDGQRVAAREDAGPSPRHKTVPIGPSRLPTLPARHQPLVEALAWDALEKRYF